MATTNARTMKFGGYHRRRSAREDAELTHTSAGTPGGEYLRCMWQPVCLAEELGDVPLCVRMLGEDLVLFRTRAGALGLVEKHCSHRGASLEYGLPTERGLQCCYHGWHFAPDGTVLERNSSLAAPLYLDGASSMTLVQASKTAV